MGPGRSGQSISIGRAWIVRYDCLLLQEVHPLTYQMADDLSSERVYHSSQSIPVSRTYLTFPDWNESPPSVVGFPEDDSRKNAGAASSKREVKNGNYS